MDYFTESFAIITSFINHFIMVNQKFQYISTTLYMRDCSIRVKVELEYIKLASHRDVVII